MAWKGDLMALGDAEGCVAIWEWRSRHFRYLPHFKSGIKKLRFAPGKHNMKLLIHHMEGFDIWDIKGKQAIICFKLSTTVKMLLKMSNYLKRL